MLEYPKKLIDFLSHSDSKKLGLFNKILSNPNKYNKSICLIGDDNIKMFNTINWCDPLTLSQKLYWIKNELYETPKCVYCESPLKWISSLHKYNDKFCNAKCMGNHKRENNVVRFDLEKAKELYLNKQMSVNRIAKEFGHISNVTIMKYLSECVDIRSHSENIKLNHYSGPYKGPKIIYDSTVLIDQYNSGITIRSLASIYNCHPETIRRLLNQAGVNTHQKTSEPEKIIKAILDNHNIKYEQHNRKIIHPKEVDFYIPEFRIGIEVNGLYRHSLIAGKKEKSFHYDKFKGCEEKGIQLLQFWDSEIYENKNTIESFILNKCGQTKNKIYARKCIIKEISSTDAQIFCASNHLQGSSTRMNFNVGLVYNNEVVSVLICAIKNNKCKLHRFCNKLNTNVVGGFSKLLKTLPESINTIVTYSNNSYSNGELYRANGFKETTFSLDLHYTDYKQLLNRRSFQKKYLDKKLDIFDVCKTEQQNMIDNGYDVIWGPGIKTWIKEVE